MNPKFFLMKGWDFFFVCYILTLYLIEMPFNTFANRADPDQAALVRAA